jgi:hypothetical protein
MVPAQWSSSRAGPAGEIVNATRPGNGVRAVARANLILLPWTSAAFVTIVPNDAEMPGAFDAGLLRDNPLARASIADSSSGCRIMKEAHA